MVTLLGTLKHLIQGPRMVVQLVLLVVRSVRSPKSHPDLLVTQHHHHPLFQITPVLNTGLSLSEPLQLYKGYNTTYIKAINGLDVLASWLPCGFDWAMASLMMTWGHLGYYLGTTWG